MRADVHVGTPLAEVSVVDNDVRAGVSWDAVPGIKEFA